MDDLISRQAAIESLDKRFDAIPMEQTTEILLLRRDLRDLPSVDRPSGHWIYKRMRGIKTCKCSECLTSYGCMDTPYCPNCGADMRGEEE